MLEFAELRVSQPIIESVIDIIASLFCCSYMGRDNFNQPQPSVPTIIGGLADQYDAGSGYVHSNRRYVRVSENFTCFLLGNAMNLRVGGKARINLFFLESNQVEFNHARIYHART